MSGQPLAGILAALSAPAEFSVKPGEVRFIRSGRSGRYEAKAEPYLRRRTVIDRLDSVLGGAWRSRLSPVPGGAVPLMQCELSILTAEGWIERTDLGAGIDASGDGWKIAATDSLKRAARLFGVGAFLDGASVWLPCAGKKQKSPEFVEWIDDPRPAIEARIVTPAAHPLAETLPAVTAKVAGTASLSDVHRAATAHMLDWPDVINLADSLFSESDPRRLTGVQMFKLIAAMADRRAV